MPVSMEKRLFFLMIFLISLTSITLTSALVIKSVSMSPEEIAPGGTSNIQIEIKNEGDHDIEDVSVLLDLKDSSLPFAPFDSSSEYSFDEIREGKTKTANFKIITLNDAKSGIYKIPLEISYVEKDEAKTKSSLISAIVNSKPIMEVNYEDGLLLKGKNNQLSFRIVNKGLADVRFLEIELGGSTNYGILSQKKAYIGDVDSNDFQTAEYEVFFNENAPGLVNVPISILYRDISNKEYFEDFNLVLKVYSEKQAENLGLLPKSRIGYYITIALAVVIIFFIYRFIKNRRGRRH